MKKHCVPYIRANHQGNFIFWSYLSSFKNSKEVVGFLHQESINFEKKVTIKLLIQMRDYLRIFGQFYEEKFIQNLRRRSVLKS